MSIDDQAGLTPENIADKFGDEEMREPEVISSGGGFKLPDWFYIERLTTPIEEYKTHAFNFNNSEGMAYIIRGFSALAGNVLNFWWTDVIGGFIRLRKDGSKVDGSKVVNRGILND